MTSPNPLSVTVDADNADSATDASVKQHQIDHQRMHRAFNRHSVPRVGDYYSDLAHTGGVLVSVADRSYVTPLWLPIPMSIDQIGLEVTTAVAAATTRVALYESDADHQPTTLIVEGPAIDSATVGIKTSTLATAIVRPVGFVWVFVGSAAALRWRACQYKPESPLRFSNPSNVMANASGYGFDLVAGATPPATWTNTTASSTPFVFIRRSA